MKTSETIFGAIALLCTFVGAFALGSSTALNTGKEPFQRTCPATSPNQERLAYATYHHDGRLTCTYIVHEIGRARRELTTGVEK